jgi:hypothetical protein
VRLVSPCAHGLSDRRRLGAAISAVACAGIPVALDDRRLATGFHGLEGDGAQAWRWTDGDALLLLEAYAGPVTLDVEVVAVAR